MSLKNEKKPKNNHDATKAIPPEGYREAFILHLADNALILGHRNSEWTGHGPILEQDIAISNIALDLVGQARNFYQYAAKIMNDTSSPGKENNLVSEDTLAYHRDVWDFKNCLLVEQPNGDWAKTILRQFFFSLYQFYLYEELQFSKDKTIAAISEKALKEITYHVKWSSEWVIRLGDGTTESHARLLQAVEDLWRFTTELFIPADYDFEVVSRGIGVDVSLLKPKWYQKLIEIFEEAAIPLSTIEEKKWIGFYGKTGKHSEHLGYILAEMQFVQRAYPGSEW